MTFVLDDNIRWVLVLARMTFGVWLLGITLLAVVPHADDGLMVKTNVTASGMEKHIAGYFVGALLLYWGFLKKRGERAPRLNTLRCPSEFNWAGMTEDAPVKPLRELLRSCFTGQGGRRSSVPRGTLLSF